VLRNRNISKEVGNKFLRVMKEAATFVGKVMFKLKFELKIFLLFTYNI
jgi:hypothetical protein